MKRILFLTAVILAALMLIVSCDNKNNEPEAKTYSVLFDYDNGSGFGTTEVKEGEKVEKPADPEKTGYTFMEWQLNGEVYDFENTVVTSNILLKAVWTIKKYKVTFNTDGGTPSSYEAQEIEYGSRAEDPGIPSKNSSNFGGWLYDGDKEFSFDTEITRDYDLTAKWNVYILINDFKDVTFNVDGDTTIVSSQSIRKYSYAHKPAKDPVSNYKTFKFWSADKENEFSFETTKITSNTTLYAVWEDDIYYVGGRGPAGGYIFYDCDADNNSGNADGLISSICGWRYLEAAPGDLKGKYIFGYYAVSGTFAKVGTYTEVGKGLENTYAIEKVMVEANNAALNCKTYSITSIDGIKYDDWFLPSIDELKLMYNNLFKNDLGSFPTGSSGNTYLSSSESGAGAPYVMEFWDKAAEDTPAVSQYNFERSVRPVRRF